MISWGIDHSVAMRGKADGTSFVHGHDLAVDGGAVLGGQRWEDGLTMRA